MTETGQMGKIKKKNWTLFMIKRIFKNEKGVAKVC